MKSEIDKKLKYIKSLNKLSISEICKYNEKYFGFDKNIYFIEPSNEIEVIIYL